MSAETSTVIDVDTAHWPRKLKVATSYLVSRYRRAPAGTGATHRVRSLAAH